MYTLAISPCMLFPATSVEVVYDAPRGHERFLNPASKTRARMYFSLVEDYGYPPELIEFDVVVKTGLSIRMADIVVYRDRAHAKPYLVVSCREEWLPDNRFAECASYALTNAQELEAQYAVCAAGSRFQAMRADGTSIDQIPYEFAQE